MKLHWPGLEGRWREFWKKYGPFLLVAALGTVLMVLPAGGKTENTHPREQEEAVDLPAFEEKLADTLSNVKGAGRVEVVLSLDSGGRKILAQNIQRDGERTAQDTVTLGRGSGGQSVVPLQTMEPEFRGALIVCPGGGDPQVRLALLKAVSALTGLGADRVCICESAR